MVEDKFGVRAANTIPPSQVILSPEFIPISTLKLVANTPKTY